MNYPYRATANQADLGLERVSPKDIGIPLIQTLPIHIQRLRSIAKKLKRGTGRRVSMIGSVQYLALI